jgi:hypothetical protein
MSAAIELTSTLIVIKIAEGEVGGRLRKCQLEYD